MSIIVINMKLWLRQKRRSAFLAMKQVVPADTWQLITFIILIKSHPIIETKTYAAELPVRKKCTLCGTTKPWSIEDISNRNIWIEHTKEVVVHEAWDEEFYIDEDSYKYDEDNNEIFVPAGSLIDTIHHPRRTNTEVEYLENINTGEKIYVEVSSCKHSNFKIDYKINDRLRCVDCGICYPSINELFE